MQEFFKNYPKEKQNVNKKTTNKTVRITSKFRRITSSPYLPTFDIWWQQKVIHTQASQQLKIYSFKYVWTFVITREKNFFWKLFPSYKPFCLYVYLNQNRDPPSFLLISPLHLHPLLIHLPEFPNQYTSIKLIKTSTLLMAALFDSTSALLLIQILIFFATKFRHTVFYCKKWLELVFIWIMVLWPTAITAVSFLIWYSRSFLLFKNKFSTLFWQCQVRCNYYILTTMRYQKKCSLV